MKVAVKDANVLIDLAIAGLLAAWFDLGIETHTTDLVLAEIKDFEQREVIDEFIRNRKLLIDELTGEQIKEAAMIRDGYGISIADASAVCLALRLGAILVTGDGPLRKAARAEDVRVCGLLWIFDELVDRRILSGLDAARCLRQVLSNGSFLPHAECEERLRAWEQLA